MTPQTVFEQLGREGLVTGDTPGVEIRPAVSPWYVRTMLGVAGWIAGLMMVGFFTSLFALLVKNGPAMVVLGLILCAGAIFFYKLEKGEVVDQIGLAVSMCGQILVAAGLFEQSHDNWHSTAFVLAIFQAVLAGVMPNFLHRVLSTVFACVAMYFWLSKTNATGVGAMVIALPLAALWLQEARWRATKHAEAFAAITWGLTFSALVWPVHSHVPSVYRPASVVPDAVGFGLALVAFAAFASRGASVGARIAALVGTVALSVVAYKAPGVLACAFILLAGYRAGSTALVTLAAIGVMGYLSAYYYQLGITLLEKAQVLGVMGAALLVVGAAMHWMPRKEAR